MIEDDLAKTQNVMLPKVEIKADGYGSYDIVLDGHPLTGVVSFSLRNDYGEPPRLDLTIIPSHVAVEVRPLLAVHIQRS